MPTTPRTWVPSTFVSAKYLNNDLYSYVPYNNHAPNGVLFHSIPPMKVGWMSTSGFNLTSAATAGGSATNIFDTGTTNHWSTYVNNEAMYVGATGVYQGFAIANTPGADGNTAIDTNAGFGLGNYLCFAKVGVAAMTNATGYVSAGIFNATSTTSFRGGSQLPSTVQTNKAYCLDLVPVGSLSPQELEICAQSILEDASASSFAAQSNTLPTGNACEIGYLWVGMGNSNGTPPVVPALPSPIPAWSSASSTNLNNSVSQVLEFLNNRPQCRVTTNQAGSVAVSTVTALNFTTASYDNYAGYSATTHRYTVPVSGVYLVHVLTEYSDALAGQRRAGVQVNGTTIAYGPSYGSATGSGFIRPQVTRLLDLNAGDTVQGITTTLTSAGTLSDIGNMLIVWMGSQSASSSLAYAPPDVTFRWTAGVQDAALLAQFNAHLGNDLEFLLNRPYLLTYQTSAQSGLAQNAFQQLVMQSATGRIHGINGDNYGGWTSGASNHYSAKVPGWYLVVGGGMQVPGATVPYVGISGFTGQNSLGGAFANILFQQMSSNNNAGTTSPPGADGLALIYLSTGDEIWPIYAQDNGAATFATSVVAGCESHFSLVWVSE